MMEAAAAQSDTAADARVREKDDHLTRLIMEKHDAAKRIESLEAEVASLRERLQQRAYLGMLSYSEGLSAISDKEETLKNAWAAEMSSWNKELINTVEELQRSLIQLEAESKAQSITLTDRLIRLQEENERWMRENDSLKARLGDDILRQRQTKRMEVASERFRIAARVRTAGRQRLEAMEGNLMEAHDDLYHVQRWDAILLPQRDVSFVFHFVSKLTFPLQGIEEFTMRVCQQYFLRSSTFCRGYRVGFYKSMEVFVFHAPSDALLFAKECHKELMRLSWSSLILSGRSFSPIVEDGTVLYKGPRIHTCIFSCSPESYVDPVSGKYAFFGAQVMEAVQAAVEQSPIGEIAVNERWAQLMCLQSRMHENRSALTTSNVAELRESLGPTWDVIRLPGARRIIASILPSELRSRRGVQPNVLHPSHKYPCLELQDSASVVREVVHRMKGMLVDTFVSSEGCSKRRIGSGGVIQETAPRHPRFLREATTANSLHASAQEYKSDFSKDSAQVLELLTTQEEKKNLTALCQKMESACAALERNMMESEDRFEIFKRKPLDPSETAYICTIDICDEAVWRRLLMTSISDEQVEAVRNTIRGHIHKAAKTHFGFLMGGNYSDVFTYVFREVEKALAFLSEIYITVNRTGTKYAHLSLGKNDDVLLFRAGVVCGSMSTVYRHLEDGVLKCRGPAIRLSGTLCDLAEFGEILAMEDVVRSFHSTNENLMDTNYNIVKKGSQFISSADAPASVHSILPKPFAFRRQHLLRSRGKAAIQSKKIFLPCRSVLETLAPRRDELPRQIVLDMMEQQRRRIELAEMARMSAEDDYERTCEVGVPQDPLLLNSWLLRGQSQAEAQPETLSRSRSCVRLRPIEDAGAEILSTRRPTKPLTFLYCSVADADSISHSVASSLLKPIWAHYNYIVQSSVRQFRGYVAKTDSVTAYLVLFEEPVMALEAARQIQLEMLGSSWPEELLTLESTLHVRDIKNHTVLFNGPRPKIAAHVSDQYTWHPISIASGPTSRKGVASRKVAKGKDDLPGNSVATSLNVVHIGGVGVDETFVLAGHAHGGEIRLSRSLLEAVGKSPSGKLLLGQFSMQVVVAPSVIRPVEGFRGSGSSSCGTARKVRGKKEGESLKGNVFAEECVISVPRQLEGRLSLMLPLTSTVYVTAKLTEENLAMVTASTPQRGEPLTFNKEGSEDSGEDIIEDTINSDSDIATVEANSLAASALPKAMLLPGSIMAQYVWLVQPSKSANPLPAAWYMDWDALMQQPGDRRAELRFLEEVRGIQAAVRGLIRMFPSTQHQYQALKGLSDERAIESPAEPFTANSSDKVTGGAGGRKTRFASRASGKVKNSPISTARTHRGADEAEESKDISSSDPSPMSATARRGTQAVAFRQYLGLMSFSKNLVLMLLNALEIATEDRLPLPLSIPRDRESRMITVTDSKPSSAGSARAAASRGGRGSLQSHSRTSASGRVSGASIEVMEYPLSESMQQLGLNPLPSITASGERPQSSQHVGSWVGSSNLTLSPLGSDLGTPQKGFSDSHPGGSKEGSEPQFLNALDYLDNACRILTQISGTVLGKTWKTPPVPPPRSKDSFRAPRGKRP